MSYVKISSSACPAPQKDATTASSLEFAGIIVFEIAADVVFLPEGTVTEECEKLLMKPAKNSSHKTNSTD